MDDIPGFVSGEDYVRYASPDDLLDKISEYLFDEEKRKRIARSGQTRVKEAHTYVHRAAKIVEDLEQLP
jgi:spore maturation protein CgeB